MASDVLDWFPKPRGQEHHEWPEWTKPQVSGRSRRLGCSEFIGDEPYTEPTPRQLDAFKDFIPDDDTIRLKSASVREAIGEYMPDGLFFKEWLPLFTDLLDRPAYYLAVWGALERITHQFNLRPPELEASSAVVAKYLERGPNLARYVLSFAQNRIEARDHPELVVAMAMFQASHRCFIDGLTNHLQAARMQGRLSWDRWDVAYAVTDGPFRQFDDFMIFSTLFPLTLHVRARLAAETDANTQNYQQLTTAAITEAWGIFTKKTDCKARICRRRPYDLSGKSAFTRGKRLRSNRRTF